MKPAELHAMVEASVNAGDLESLVSLYEPDAVLLAEDGTSFAGTGAIRDAWAAVIGFQGKMVLTTRTATEVADLALLSNCWTYEIGGTVVAGGITAEVARRQADGTWLYVIDNPYAAPAP